MSAETRTIIGAPFRLRAGSVSVRGTFRPSGDDGFGVSFYISSDAGLSVIADGTGGRGYGEAASQAAVLEIVHHACGWPVLTNDSAICRSMGLALEAASRAIVCRSFPITSCTETGTALALALRFQDCLLVTSVGDSRVYRLREGKLERLAGGDSWAEILKRTGLGIGEDKQFHRRCDTLVPSLGNHDFSVEDLNFQFVEIVERDRYLLTTAGAHRVLSDERIRNLLGTENPMQQIAESLQGCPGERDDATCVVVDVEC